jgi:hypothetical protein
MVTPFLTIEEGRLVAYTGLGAAWNTVTVIDTPEALEAVTAEHGALLSSSIHFPHEYTSDPAVLALVALLG